MILLQRAVKMNLDHKIKDMSKALHSSLLALKAWDQTAQLLSHCIIIRCIVADEGKDLTKSNINARVVAPSYQNQPCCECHIHEDTPQCVLPDTHQSVLSMLWFRDKNQKEHY